MEARAVQALEYCKRLKQQRIDEHKNLNSQERPCRGLTNREWYQSITRQKTTFSKGKKFASTRLWNHNHVPTEDGFLSLTIKIKSRR
jgi:hypothetical protein